MNEQTDLKAEEWGFVSDPALERWKAAQVEKYEQDVERSRSWYLQARVQRLAERNKAYCDYCGAELSDRMHGYATPDGARLFCGECKRMMQRAGSLPKNR